ncbi:XRE family transcriptional regulator [Alicyclobacillaceae bacterium I2511]|nr:XRE family transcriptional regulator [Alicyclobacillaceae bacterium I2511]
MPRIIPRERITEKQMSEFILWLLIEREKRGWNQTEMAEFLGFSAAYYNALENKKKQLSAKSIIKLADKLQGLSFVTDLLGEPVVRKYVHLGGSRNNPAEQLLNQDKFLLKKAEENAELSHEIDLLAYKLGSDRSVYGVSVTRNLAWFGFFEGRHFALIQPIQSIEELHPHQLVYIINRQNEKNHLFMFVDDSNPLEPQLITPEAMVVKDLNIPLQKEELSKWNLDLEDITRKFPVNNLYITIGKVFCMIDLLEEKPKAYQYPLQYVLDPENQKIVMSAAWTAYQKQHYEHKFNPDEITTGNPEDPNDPLRTFGNFPWPPY